MQSATVEISAATTVADLEKIRVAVLGRKGELTAISKTLGTLAPEDRAEAGQLLNKAKTTLEPPKKLRARPARTPARKAKAQRGRARLAMRSA